MKCQKCKKEFEEKDIHESHDVPCYLFEGNRKGQKNQADKWGRRYLCKKCHDEYENSLRVHLRNHAWTFAILYFREEKDGDSISEI
jgi:hypothetical protein